ncbi:hypothetical protein AB4347_07535 [Vibrio breoganii]|uniref:hypothetical protein n=1 Tax=Vibrio breoganii TaxID=553239 RepID=UPI001056B330|nr:hypothetical protein [Vibrio breoganii]
MLKRFHSHSIIAITLILALLVAGVFPSVSQVQPIEHHNAAAQTSTDADCCEESHQQATTGCTSATHQCCEQACGSLISLPSSALLLSSTSLDETSYSLASSDILPPYKQAVLRPPIV